MTLHSAGHRRGVVAAPHAAAVEAGRAILAEGGNAIEAMLAMAATIAAVYPHMNHIGGDGFWLVREPSGRVRALMGAGPAGAKATPRLYREPVTTKFRRAGRLPRSRCRARSPRWMLARGRRQSAWRQDCRSICCCARHQACARRICCHAQPGAADSRKACRRWTRPSASRQTFLLDGKVARGRRAAEADSVCRDARAARACRA